ncbi:hypothetical protein TWF506_001936 [Arthrobotrys conoides]|uniref:Uncharacterized protein n=1 Tax=Arthrobotrys conoides TaxID=74498 RepID=A0AAN8S280_9PEZI
MAGAFSNTAEFQELIRQTLELDPKDLVSAQNHGSKDVHELTLELKRQMAGIRTVILRGDRLSEEEAVFLDLKEHSIYSRVAFYRLAAAKIFCLAVVLVDTIEKGIKVVTPHGQDIVIVPAQWQGVVRCEQGASTKSADEVNSFEQDIIHLYRELDSAWNKNQALAKRIKTLKREKAAQEYMISSLRSTLNWIFLAVCFFIALVVTV